MSDKPVAMGVTALIVAPIAVICCGVAPLLAAGAFAGLGGWLARISPLWLILAALGVGIALLARRDLRRRAARLRHEAAP
jgi:uncharacterized membrane protein YgaE (UPF0421/DUF939 family)